MAKRSGTDGSLLASLPWTLGALAFSLAPHVQHLPVWITTAFLGCAVWRWDIEYRRRALPLPALRVILALICFLGVFGSYESVSGVGPGSALLAIMAALKLLETRRRRDQFVLLFISIFLVMASLLREQYMWSLPYLLLAVALTMTAWLRMSLASADTSVTASLKTNGRLIAYASPLMLAMWILFPRISTPFWAIPVDTSSAASGISDRMSPGDISSLSLSDAVAFRVKFDGSVPEPRDRYWRGLVLYRFNGRTWTGWEPIMDRSARDELFVGGEPVRYQVTMEPTRQQWVFALDIPYQWSRHEIFMGPQYQLAKEQPIDQRMAFEATSYTRYRINPRFSSYFKTWYAKPPPGNPRTVELAQSMRSQAADDESFIAAVLGKFHDEEYFYTLEPPALGSNPVDEFMFDTRRGFCEHFASAFAVMMRAAGIPSRIVLGYQGGELNPMGQYLIVRQADAHAWTEVWLPDRGWYRVDPTGAVAPERIESGISGAMMSGVGAGWGLSAPIAFLHSLGLTWDAVNARWNDWILGYGPDKQESFLEWLGMDTPDWRKMMLTLTLLVTAIIAAISLGLVLRYRPPPKDYAAILYRKFTQKAGLVPKLGESPQAFMNRLWRENEEIGIDAERVTDLYLNTRYGPPRRHTLDQLRAAVADFRC
ncbi:MAG: transglutaminaseTgpA domain-containing protein [Woeseia sp.]